MRTVPEESDARRARAWRRRALGWAARTSLLAACSAPAEAPAERHADPCPDLLAEYDALRASRGCTEDAECVAVPGLGRPVEARAPGAESRPPCGSEAHRDVEAALEATVDRFRAAGCGRVGRPRSTACATSTHGLRIGCFDGRCRGVF